jgi:ferric-dicitrate binding protein FerR (iron transport regulator)
MTPLHAHATLTAAMHRMLADDPAAIRAALSQPPRPSNRARAIGAAIGAAIAIAATAAALWLRGQP